MRARLEAWMPAQGDQRSYPFLSCYGEINVKTPALDRLAAAGMKFHRFFTTAPQCVPSRASLLTGRSPAPGIPSASCYLNQ
jgi:arylsulfatase A-like enzyme